MEATDTMRNELLALLRGGNAHMGLDDALADFPLEEINRRVPNANYRVWHLLEHMRIAQWDILEFVRNPRHVSPPFPDGYWPKPDETASPAKWQTTIEGFRSDLRSLEDLVMDPHIDFFGPLPHAKEYTVFREILLAADHNIYHVSEIVTLRRVLDMNPVKEY